MDTLEARLLLALCADPRATVSALAQDLGVTRNTVQARLAGLFERGVVRSFERSIDPAAIGFPLSAYVTVEVTQRRLDEVAAALATIPEVVEVIGLSGPTDLLVAVVARDADDLYRIAGQILATPDVQRTQTSLAMRQLVPHRLAPLLRARAGQPRGARTAATGTT
ncbi:Lrp/AsnC family transcriptional regulator [Dactylosporangium sp. CA-092794]|uniref:Lrp/AsnC family transcriptional regulator n=1 Tax=Dactylosporangium sp. CA-092794 TaxID=3239929 RepID=UPI003D8C57C4